MDLALLGRTLDGDRQFGFADPAFRGERSRKPPAGFYGASQDLQRFLVHLNFIHRHDVGFGILHLLEEVKNPARGCQQRDKEGDEPPDRPFSLYPPEMLETLPLFVSPGPGIALESQDEEHEDIDKGHKDQQGDIGLVEDSPYPIPEKGAPVPAPARQFGRKNGLFALTGCVFHMRSSPKRTKKVSMSRRANDGLRKDRRTASMRRRSETLGDAIKIISLRQEI